MGLLDGKTAVITGGGGALGRAYALAIAQAGAAVAVSDVNLDTALWRLGRSEEEIRNLLVAGNILHPAEFANIVVWLVSDQSKPLSGEFIARDPHRGSVLG